MKIDLEEETRKYWKTIALVAILVAITLFAQGILRLSFILPTFEGPSAGVAGISLNANNPSSVVYINQPLSSPWQWKSTDPHQAAIYHAGSLLGGDCQVEIDVQNPQPVGAPAGTVPQSFSYWVNTTNPDGSKSYVYVTDQVNFYIFYIDIKAIDTGSLNPCHFTGNDIWIQLISSVWNNALQVQNEPSGNSTVPVLGTAWEAPIFASVSNYQQSGLNGGSCLGYYHDVAPDHQGADITFYSAPGASTLSDLGYSQQQNVGKNLEGTNPLAPSTALSENAYFSIGLQNYGVTKAPSTCSAISDVSPVTSLTISLVTIQIGKYTFTEPVGVQPAHKPPTPSGGNDTILGFLGGIQKWFSNPINTFILYIAIFALIVAVAFVAVKAATRREV